MGLKCNVDMNAMRSRFSRFFDEVEKKQIERLKMLGEMCVTQARGEHANNWQDQTGNLRSSVGYMVFKDGVSVEEGTFEQITPRNPQPGDVYDGATRGMQFCKTIGDQTRGIALVVVAGMSYASYVEKNGKDVLTSAEQLAERELPKMLEELKSNIIKAAE